MKDFRRVLHLVTKRRWTLAGCIFTSVFVALLWGLNIGALYPMVEIVFKGDGVPGYIAKEIDNSLEQIAETETEIAEINQQLSSKPGVEKRNQLELSLEFAITRRTAYESSLDSLRWFQPYANQYLPETAFGTLSFMIGLLIAGTLLKLVALGINLMLVQDLAMRAANDVRSLFFRRALRLDLDEFGDNGSAGLTSRLTNDIGHLNGGITVLLGRLVREPLKMIVCFAGAAWVCPRLLLLVMVVAPLMVIIMHSLSRSIRRASRRVMDEMTQLYGMLNDAFSGIRVIKAYNTQAFERARFERSIHAYYGRSMKMALYNTLARSVSEFLGLGMVCLAILAGGYLVINRQTELLGLHMSNKPLGPGEMLMFFGFLIGASDPARKLSDVWSGLQRGVAAASRVYEVIDRPVRVTEPARPQSVARPHQNIIFSNVTFRYPSGPPVLNGIDLTIPRGECLAVVGPNGSGKSTLISLLCRFDDPQGGEVLLDNVPLPKMSLRNLRRRIGLVTQRTVLFDDTILNNIRYGMPRVSREDVILAAKQAYADDFIREKTEFGYDTPLGQNGVRLSGGQMQRIALARAFLRKPDILILDEATSQIDMESEALIHEALKKFLVNRTGLMITHRPTTLALADRIAVIEEGILTDIGPHNTLLAKNAFYRSLCRGDSAEAA
ncbi:Lipid A export ATP-binding/permease protein MsbA [Roseimaritima multifibrata]|uniref:Lipid A export ATP-binding/permease protein MsbA n=1 Tax=Roseimaritima multifibrata TaxID=1930274 RepID=A0A517MNV2_9BACT|nr:ABC transporter ATP-binding protein [Roseimaritima multifibrata]QDS96559.1 Lipid A export ATP-binding/permease protein MsbA [Roseimaritima multifibrata]